MVDLLPCPLCGSKAALCVLEDNPGEVISAWVNCSCGVETHERRTEEEAAEHWNRRSAEKIIDQIRPAAELLSELMAVIEAVRGDRDVIRVSGKIGDRQDIGVTGIDVLKGQIEQISRALRSHAGQMRTS